MSNHGDSPDLDDAATQMYKTYYLVSFWIEANIYGLYLCLFAVALSIMFKRQALDTTSSRVFLAGIISMFVMITFHNSINVYRMLSAYGLYDPAFPDRSISILMDMARWDAYAFPIILAILTWIGDILVIYRCFLIWHRNYYIIILPVLLLLASIATSAVNLWWFRHPQEIPWRIMDPLFKLTYPLNFVQNVLTTSFIAYRIYTQDQKSQKTGLKPHSDLDLITVIRIVVESALIYTVQMAIMIILYFVGHPALVIVQHALAPSLGIVFVLIAIRIHVAKNGSGSMGSHTVNAIVPTWLTSRDDTNHSNDNETPGTGRRMRFLTASTVEREEHQLDVMGSHNKSEFEIAATVHRTVGVKMDRPSSHSDSEDTGVGVAL